MGLNVACRGVWQLHWCRLHTAHSAQLRMRRLVKECYPGKMYMARHYHADLDLPKMTKVGMQPFDIQSAQFSQ